MAKKNNLSKEIHDALDQSARALMGADACPDPKCGSDQCSAFQAICKILPEIKTKYLLGPSHREIKKKAKYNPQDSLDSFRTDLVNESFEDNIDKAIAWVLSRKEEIIIAFIAKFGVQPEMIEIRSSQGNEAVWFLRKKETTALDITAKELCEWMDQKGSSWKESLLDIKAAAIAINKGEKP